MKLFSAACLFLVAGVMGSVTIDPSTDDCTDTALTDGDPYADAATCYAAYTTKMVDNTTADTLDARICPDTDGIDEQDDLSTQFAEFTDTTDTNLVRIRVPKSG